MPVPVKSGQVARYIVVLPNGERYGPATVAVLAQWVAEGRVLPSTLVEIEGSGQVMTAATVPGIDFSQSRPPVGSPTPATDARWLPPVSLSLKQPGDDEATVSGCLSGSSLLCACCGLGLAPAALALVLALVARHKGSPKASIVLWFAGFALALNAAFFFLSRSLAQ
jgi:hypothetical protein